MNEIPKFAAPQSVTTGPDRGLAQSLRSAEAAAPTSAFRSAKSRSPIRTSRRSGSTIRPAPTPKATSRSISPRACRRARGLDRRARLRRNRSRARSSPRTTAMSPPTASRRFARRTDPARRQARPARHPIRIRPRRHRHRRDDLCRPSRESGARGGGRGRGGAARRRRKLRRGHSRIHHAGIRARGSRARAGDHSRQHQSPRTRADGDRPQFSGQGQRQHRQFGGELRRRRGSREDGLGDPLGRRHGDGPLDRPQHPQHPLLDPAQFAGADRHGADLSGAGEGRRRSAQARLGSVQGHADRAGRAGRRLFHHPRRRAPRPCAADRQARDRHRLARRLDHGALVPRGPSRKLPLRALRRHLRHHAQVRRLVLARRRPAAGLDRRRQRRARNSPSWRRWAN